MGHREDNAVEGGYLTWSGWVGEGSHRGMVGSAHRVW